jgi:allantoinase
MSDKNLEMLYDHTLGHDGVVMWTGAEILNWDRAQVGVVRQPIPE